MSSAFYPEDFSQDMISQQSPALFLEPSAKNLPRYATACAGAVYLMPSGPLRETQFLKCCLGRQRTVILLAQYRSPRRSRMRREIACEQ